MQVLAEDLPLGTIRCGCHIVSLKLEPFTSFPILQLRDGQTVKAKLKPKKVFSKSGVRGLTNYPNGHGLASEFVLTHKGNMVFGNAPINQNLVFWFVLLPGHHQDTMDLKNQEFIRQMCLENINDRFPNKIMVQDCDTCYLSLTFMTYRTPWEMLVGSFRKGTVTVAGDAMHLMGPFPGQGTSSAIEDGIVLARCLAQNIHDQPDLLQGVNGEIMQNDMQRKVEAIDAFVKDRMRLVALSAQTYLTCLLMATYPMPFKLLFVVSMVVLFRDTIRHTRYDCGPL
ncbi:hypothetical protein FNV43_RR19224 [Rhamnella rubrinervis]|uniref:FAD-binding domain-containing protein n=1 Tax=Rhamnella rubrinervis TaxID=2594499 RepID=A0A8K0GX07_9ROSA|nr:hypothetical protein FNV43_RR19224 [Rhamnella rubrinervis]